MGRFLPIDHLFLNVREQYVPAVQEEILNFSFGSTPVVK
jgi:hypothetical protein